MDISLYKDLAKGGYHSSIMTTFSVDPAFYDEYIHYRLRTSECMNNILMADAAMLQQALQATPKSLKGAGSTYAVMPIGIAGCFHPKIHLRLGEKKARLIIGSANATAAGWGGNREVITTFEWVDGDPNNAAIGALIRKAYDYLTSWLSQSPGSAIQHKLDLHTKYSPWLTALKSNEAPLSLPDGTGLDIFFEKAGGESGMMTQLLNIIGTEKALRLIVVSPYWDMNLRALKELCSTLKGCPVIIAFNPAKNEFPCEFISEFPNIKFISVPVDERGKDRYVHAKIILVETADADHVLFGSANCSNNALGGLTKPARNAEASVYRRVSAGSIRELLQLDLNSTVEIDMISSQASIPQKFNPTALTRHPGTVELFENTLIWWPTDGTTPEGSHILIDGTAIFFKFYREGEFHATLPKAPDFPFVIKIQLADGTECVPVIVHDATRLQIEANIVPARIKKIFKEIEDAETDLVGMFLKAYPLLFKNKINSAQRTQSGEKKKGDSAKNGQDYNTPEEFRSALVIARPKQEGRHYSTNNPSLLYLLRNILGDLGDIQNTNKAKNSENAEEGYLLDGEVEDGSENAEDKSVISPLNEIKKAATQRVYPYEEFSALRQDLMSTLDAFQQLLEVLTGESEKITPDVVGQSIFILEVMRYACCIEYKMEDGKTAKLMQFSSDASDQKESTLIVRTAKILHRLWIGWRQGAILDFLEIDPRYDNLPADVFRLAMVSRWATARAYLDTSGNMSERMREQTVKIYLKTCQWGVLDPVIEEGHFQGLDKELGFTAEQTAKLIKAIRKLSTPPADALTT